MRYRTGAVVVAVVALLACVASGAHGQTLRTDQEKTSYAIGAQMGRDMKRYGMSLDPDAMARGFKDAYQGGRLALSEQEIAQLSANAQRQMAAKTTEVMKEDAEKNKREGDAFLARNRTAPGVRTLADGLEYKVLKTGTGRTARPTDRVVVNYRGTFIDGTEFDSSYRRNQPLAVTVNGVIRGWSEALQLMPVGSKWQLFIPPHLAYGPQGAPPAIGPNETLVFEIELLAIQ
jgi:FKBP-type peptidyl-prolyl cis-trans isomerase FklB